MRSTRPRRPRALPTAATLVVLALSACTAGTTPAPSSPPPSSPAPSPTTSAPPAPVAFRVTAPSGPAVVVAGGDPAAAALAASRAVFAAAPVVVLAPADDVASQLTAASAAVALGAPVLLVGRAAAEAPTRGAPGGGATTSKAPGGAATTGAGPAGDAPTVSPAVRDELSRLGADAVLVVGPAAVPTDVEAVHVPAGADRAALAAATRCAFGAPVDVAAGGEAAAVGALARPAPAVLRVAGAPATTSSGTASRRPAGTAAGPSATATPRPSATPRPPTTAAPGSSTTAAPRSSATPAPGSSPSAGLPGSLPFATGTPGPGGSAPRPALPPTTPPASPPARTVALTGAGSDVPAVLATLRAAGVPLVAVPTGDPRATADAVTALAAAKPQHVVALGAAFGPAGRLAERVVAAATGVQLPGGGQLLFPQDVGLPGKRYVALYGSPGMASLGVLGEQDVPATIARAEQHAAPYRALTADTVVPGVEIIATIASAGAGPDGNYSTERPVSDLLPLVQAAADAGMTAVLDLQPGRTDFLTQAKQYEDLLALPNVGLALDPEWRLEPDQVHLRQIGHVGIDEVNAVADWLATLVRDRHLPQKMFVLHQFQLRMIDGRERLDMSHDELAVVVHVDGQGGQQAKVGTWNAIRQGAPAGLHWGWKNFYDEDTPAMLDPPATYAIAPTPDLVTYQ